MAPRVWAVLNAHDEVPVVLPTFSGLAERTLVFDSKGVQIGAFQLENSQPLDVDQVPVDVIAAILAVEDGRAGLRDLRRRERLSRPAAGQSRARL